MGVLWLYCGYITTIKELRKHSNADRLLCTCLFGNNVIVNLDYYEGQRVVYFPTDGQLSVEFAEENNLVRKKDESGNNIGGYLDPSKRNIRALKLRGERSEGLVLPIECLSKYTDVTKLADGDQITVLGGHEICRKYVPQHHPVNSQSGSKNTVARNRNEEKNEVSYPFFEEHIDTEQLAYNQQAFHTGDTIYLTRKLHGTSMRVSNALEVTTKHRPNWIKKIFRAEDRKTKKYTIVSGTRRMVLSSYSGGFYGDNTFRKKFNDMFIGKLPKGMTVYGEIVGWVNDQTPIMPKCNNSKVQDKEFSKQYGKETIFTYGCKPGENDLYVYRITMCNEDGITIELPTEEVQIWCERLGVKYVPLLEKFIYTTWEDLNERCAKYLDEPEPLANGTHVSEGVVVRIDNRDSFKAYKTKGWYFRVLEGVIKDSASAPDMEEAQEIL